MLKIKPNKKIKIPFWGICISLILIAFGLMSTSFLLARVSSDELAQILGAFGFDIGKAIFIASSVSVLINLYLKHIQEGDVGEVMEQTGISSIFSSRQNAKNYFINMIKNKKTKEVTLLGISLRDFLDGTGALSEVWREICIRLEQEEKDSIRDTERFHVKVMLLDSKSGEGRFRHFSEADTLGADGLPHDVPGGVKHVKGMQKRIYKNNKCFLELKLYEHCPFSFMVATNNEIFVEQYYYRDHSNDTSLPLIKFDRSSGQYRQLVYSLNNIWKNATLRKISKNRVGTSEGIELGEIENIYRYDRRYQCGEQQLRSIEKSDGTISIIAVTGKFYISRANIQFLEDFSVANDNPLSGIRFAIINPISQQAILRAVADNSELNKIRSTLENWTWERHSKTTLFEDIRRTKAAIEGLNVAIDKIKGVSDKGHFVELRLYSGSISCSLLMTARSSFVEQYIYGRSNEVSRKTGVVLGKEYPIFDFNVSKVGDESTVEKQILESHFKVVWDHYSISVEEYAEINQKEAFEGNLESLRKEMNMSPVLSGKS